MNDLSVGAFLLSPDPLARDAALFLANYKEEDDRVDYKETLDPTSEKSWLELTKDVSAFANTHGGYLVFGVQDRSRNLVGISAKIAEALEDVNNIQQKLNRNLEPHIEHLRSKRFRIEQQLIAIIHIPMSAGRTHVVSKDAAFKHLSGEQKILLRKGTFYVRRSAANHLGDSRDFDAVVERRLDHFRDSLLDKIARVVNAPTDSDVFILSPDPEDEEARKFIIKDAPESIAVKGMSFTVPPEGPAQEIAAWSVLAEGDAATQAPEQRVWEWYSIRDRLRISQRQRLYLLRFSLWRNIPAFYWIRGIGTQEIQDALLDAIRLRPDNDGVPRMLAVASFIGKGFYSKALQSLGSYRERLSPAQQNFPASGPENTYFKYQKTKNQTAAELRREKLAKLNALVASVAKDNKKLGLQQRWNAQDLDCFLYAQLDQYRSRK